MKRRLLDYHRVAQEIMGVGLYDPILQEIREHHPWIESAEELKTLLEEESEWIEQYEILNVTYNISNIHTDHLPPLSDELAAQVGLLSLEEPYTIPFEHSNVVISVMSIEFFVLFSVQYFIVLLDMKAWQWEIYGMFLISVVIAWRYIIYQREYFGAQKGSFEQRYAHIVALLDKEGDCALQ